MTGDHRYVLVDASVFITLAKIRRPNLLAELAGTVSIPNAVAAEITDDPEARVLSEAAEAWLHRIDMPDGQSFVSVDESTRERAASHLGRTDSSDATGDIALLAHALAFETQDESVVVVSDDKPLRKTCKALSIPLSGRIGVLVRGVESGAIELEPAREALYAMDEVGARFSASLVKRAEQLLEDAAER